MALSYRYPYGHGVTSRRYSWQRLLALSLALSVALAGCGPAAGGPEAAQPAAAVLPTMVQLPPTVVPTVTPSPTATPAPTATPLPTPAPLSAAITLDPPLVTQGHTLRIDVQTGRSAAVSGALGERALRFVSTDGLNHVALVAIGVDAPEGAHALQIEMTGLGDAPDRSPDGTALTLSTEVSVMAGSFHTELLTFEPQVDALLAPEIAQPETALVSEVYARFSSEWLWQGAFQWPLEEIRVTSPFGSRRQYGTRPPGSYHAGLDLGAVTGTPVLAAASGVVALASPLQVRGNTVILDHGAGVLSAYFHLDTIEADEGQAIEAGAVLGTVGATGLVTGSHLHWEIRVHGIAVDPTEWVERQLGGR